MNAPRPTASNAGCLIIAIALAVVGILLAGALGKARGSTVNAVFSALQRNS